MRYSARKTPDEAFRDHISSTTDTMYNLLNDGRLSYNPFLIVLLRPTLMPTLVLTSPPLVAPFRPLTTVPSSTTTSRRNNPMAVSSGGYSVKSKKRYVNSPLYRRPLRRTSRIISKNAKIAIVAAARWNSHHHTALPKEPPISSRAAAQHTAALKCPELSNSPYAAARLQPMFDAVINNRCVIRGDTPILRLRMPKRHRRHDTASTPQCRMPGDIRSAHRQRRAARYRPSRRPPRQQRHRSGRSGNPHESASAEATAITTDSLQ